MKALDFLKEEWIIADLQGLDKPSVLKELSSVLVKPCQVASPEDLFNVLAEREKIESTGIGEGIAGDRFPPRSRRSAHAGSHHSVG